MLLFLVVFLSLRLAANTQDINELEQQVMENNDALQYVNSFKLIDAFISNHASDDYNLYRAYLIKSYTHKRLFNYDDVLLCLDLALKHGNRVKEKDKVNATVMAEKAFAYFDIHQYFQAGEIMQQLRKNDFKYLSGDLKAYIIMQEGFLEYLNFNYPKAENRLFESLELMKEFCPRNLPMVYGKLVELYNKMGDRNKMMASFANGIQSAKENNIIKYEIYMNESLKDAYVKNKQFEQAFSTTLVLDSLNEIYAAGNNLTTIKMYEKSLLLKEKEIQLQQQKSTRNLLILIIGALIMLVAFFYSLIRNRRERMAVLEKENDRIREELAIIAQEKKEDGADRVDLSKFNLSSRQQEIIDLLKQGMSNKLIAAQLHISENTVKYHIKGIYEELQIENRAQLFRLYKD